MNYRYWTKTLTTTTMAIRIMCRSKNGRFVMMTKLDRIYWTEQAKKMAETKSRDEIWAIYKNAKLMDDKEEVFMCRKALEIKKAETR